MTLVSLLVLSGCSEEAPGPSPPTGKNAQGVLPSVQDPRPSIILVVIESLRTDAVRSYGPDRTSPLPLGSRTATPHLDALAEKGHRYAWAFAASSDTVTSHASLLTGRPPDEHSVGIWTEFALQDGVETLAESLSARGYETAAFVENPMAGPEAGLDQGFTTFVSPEPLDIATGNPTRTAALRKFDVVGRVERWLGTRDPSRPFFLFVNLADPHLPYVHRADNPYLDPNLRPARIQNVLNQTPHNAKICRKLPDPESLKILAGLYLGEVEAADRKLGNILAHVEAQSASATPPIHIVTADHGTHLGEKKLLGHHFSVDNRVIRVPLIIEGAPTPTGLPNNSVYALPVAQRRIADSVRCWAGDPERCASGLPLEDTEERTTGPEEIIRSIAGNAIGRRPTSAVVDTHSPTGKTLYANALCPDESGVRGRNLAYVRGSMKYLWRENGPDQLFDLEWDATESSDQLLRDLPSVRALKQEVTDFVAEKRLDQIHKTPPQGSLRKRAEQAFLAARAALLSEGRTNPDAVWFAQLVVRERPDSEIQNWIEAQLPLHEKDPFYPMMAPSAAPVAEVPSKLGRGLARFSQYLMAAVSRPDDLAMLHLEEYLDLEATDYSLTHQLTALKWAQAMKRPLRKEYARRAPDYLQAIAVEHEADSHFRDLWVERAALLSAYGAATDLQVKAWTQIIVDHHLGNGDWGHTGSDLQFDGQVQLAEHPREHIRGLAMIVLAHFLTQTDAPTD